MKAIAISALVALVLIAGCVGQTPTAQGTDCGTNATCLRTAEASCSPASGTLISDNMTMYEEIRGTSQAGCAIYFNFEQPALGSATCIVPMNMTQEQYDYCAYCEGTFIDLARESGQC